MAGESNPFGDGTSILSKARAEGSISQINLQFLAERIVFDGDQRNEMLRRRRVGGALRREAPPHVADHVASAAHLG